MRFILISSDPSKKSLQRNDCHLSHIGLDSFCFIFAKTIKISFGYEIQTDHRAFPAHRPALPDAAQTWQTVSRSLLLRAVNLRFAHPCPGECPPGGGGSRPGLFPAAEHHRCRTRHRPSPGSGTDVFFVLARVDDAAGHTAFPCGHGTSQIHRLSGEPLQRTRTIPLYEIVDGGPANTGLIPVNINSTRDDP